MNYILAGLLIVVVVIWLRWKLLKIKKREIEDEFPTHTEKQKDFYKGINKKMSVNQYGNFIDNTGYFTEKIVKHKN